MRSALLYLFFIVISAVFWCFLTFNGDIQLDLQVPLEINKPKNVHMLSKVPETVVTGSLPTCSAKRRH